MRRIVTVAALGAIIAGLLQTPASARGPKWEFQPAAPFTLSRDFCAFRVHVTFPNNKEYAKTTENPDGSVTVKITGRFDAKLRRVGTTASVTVNASGPGEITFFPDGSFVADLKGHTVAFFTQAMVSQFGLPAAVFLWAGPFGETVDANGTITSVTLKGHLLVDVCAALS
jgi:hypothetical protein